jgi:hypothetical protein
MSGKRVAAYRTVEECCHLGETGCLLNDALLSRLASLTIDELKSYLEGLGKIKKYVRILVPQP